MAAKKSKKNIKNEPKLPESVINTEWNERKSKKISDKKYDKELLRLQTELVKLQDWVKAKGKKIIVIFEGRDAAGKGGMIKRITEPLNHRVCRVAALGVPTEKEKSQWYFQRYTAYLPSAGEIVLFDRSWYNRAGVERVMGFCTDKEYMEFLRQCPAFEQAIINSGSILIKYWLAVSEEEQGKRFQERIDNPMKQWKISPMDMNARKRWYDYSRARDDMFRFTNTRYSPWYVVPADNKKLARLNCINHMLSLIPYKEIPKQKLKLPSLQKRKDYQPAALNVNIVPDIY
jgi:polyphosphate kinase 2